MNTKTFIRKLLKLKDLKISGFEFKTREATLNLIVKPYKNGATCPKCGRRCTIINKLDEPRKWEDIIVAGWKIYFWYTPREIQCPTHGRKQEMIPWAESKSQITYRQEYLIITLAKVMTQKAASELLKMASSTFSNRLQKIIERTRAGHQIRGLKTIGIDEISYKKGKKYATIVYDLDKGVVVWVGKGKGRETIDAFFEKELSEFQRKQITWASCDMSQTYIGAIKEYCINAKLVLDHFHIVKAVNEAVDEVRKEEWRKSVAQGNPLMKGLRWLLYRSSGTRTKGETKILNELKKSNNRIYRAWVLKDELEEFWKYLYQGCAEKFLKSWITRALKSRIESMKKFALTMRKNMENILPFIERNLTNATAEGINRIIKIVKNRASGFRGLDPFINMIYLIIGDVDIAAQIPKKHRTL